MQQVVAVPVPTPLVMLIPVKRITLHTSIAKLRRSSYRRPSADPGRGSEPVTPQNAVVMNTLSFRSVWTRTMEKLCSLTPKSRTKDDPAGSEAGSLTRGTVAAASEFCPDPGRYETLALFPECINRQSDLFALSLPCTRCGHGMVH